ncbi:hypothetical protein Pcinc_041749 [Petrolisthes cinctipes]|uniref:Uncharacterized protein n=1 Tax=Petrolisthes cinctipes TaxID=88211 RepID=A0AAE1BLF4_PETCI|nr:hypothetical protein Pcinc_041749 [Petrolisthes cinctipes]
MMSRAKGMMVPAPPVFTSRQYQAGPQAGSSTNEGAPGSAAILLWLQPSPPAPDSIADLWHLLSEAADVYDFLWPRWWW